VTPLTSSTTLKDEACSFTRREVDQRVAVLDNVNWELYDELLGYSSFLYAIYLCHGIILRDKPDDHELKLFVFERDGITSLY